MTPSKLKRVVSDCLDEFYRRRIKVLSSLELEKTLKRKNPYLFRAIGMQDASEIVSSLLSAYTSSSDEGIFGDAFFEPLAKAVSGGKVAPSEGVDVAIEDSTTYRAIAVKSGPSVFNSQSRRRQMQDFQSLRSRLTKLRKHFDALVGYSYGNKNSPATTDKIFRELAGQEFWAEITGDEDFYLHIISAMESKPTEHKAKYIQEWDKAKNRFVREFAEKYCLADGSIDWGKILKLNSGRKPKAKRRTK